MLNRCFCSVCGRKQEDVSVTHEVTDEKEFTIHDKGRDEEIFAQSKHLINKRPGYLIPKNGEETG